MKKSGFGDILFGIMLDLEKYCRRHPAPPFPLPGTWRGAVVIPAWDELDELPETLAALATARTRAPFPFAAVVVVNHPRGADPVPSQRTLEYLASPAVKAMDCAAIYAPDLEGGVGAARKLGMDSFLATLRGSPHALGSAVICSLDADTAVEPDYFRAVASGLEDADAVTLGFRHRSGDTPQRERAIREYEQYMDRYCAKLREAGSPYAFHAVGSAFAVSAAAYLKAGGMKVRTAGEDFYFLQEAAKTGILKELPQVLLHPSPRFSHRVPFGTGRTVEGIINGESPAAIPDAAFAVLSGLLAHSRRPSALADPSGFLAALPDVAQDFFRSEKWERVWPKILANTPPDDDARLRAFNCWFDGLKTLRLLHRLSSC